MPIKPGFEITVLRPGILVHSNTGLTHPDYGQLQFALDADILRTFNTLTLTHEEPGCAREP